MRKLIVALVLGVASVLEAPAMAQVAAPVDAPAKPTDVPVRQVVLYSSGVGYFEHIGLVKDNAVTELRFKTDQINDLLKSLILQDSGKGKIGAVVYPSQDPLAKTLRSFQVNLNDNPSLAELLGQLRGARVKVVAGTQQTSATILGVEKKPKAVDRTQIEVWVLNLFSDGSMQAVPLDDIIRIELEDPQLQAELTKALSAVAQARDQDKKPVTINFIGEGQRQVRIGYVVESPIWKTSYRLMLGKDQPQLQGWAIVENQTDTDWNDVQLTLVSGRPISFIMDLYQPLYAQRPTVQLDLWAGLKPPVYSGAMGEKLGLQRKPAGRALNAPAAASMSEIQAGAGDGIYDAAFKSDFDESVQAAATGARLGELFQYSIPSVSLPRQQSAMLPIITDPIQVEKLSIYNASVLPRNPLNGARVTNTTDKHLLQGPITVLEESRYAGDARIEDLPPGQQRLISYGVDLKMLVDASKNRQESSIVSGKIVKGVLQLKNKLVFTQEYAAENKADAEKNLIIEHPFRQNWELVAPEKPLETTDLLYRFALNVPANKPAALTVQEQLVRDEAIVLLPADFDTLLVYARTGALSQPVRDALTRAAQLKQQVIAAERQMTRARQQIAQIRQDQNGIRENIHVAPDRSDFRTTLLKKLEAQEQKINELDTQMAQAQEQKDAAQAELENYLNELNIE